MLGSDPKNVEKMMKKLNINTREIDAERVVITAQSGDIVIEHPQIMIMNMMGREVYQITGEVRGAPKAREEDIQIVMEQTGKDRSTVATKLEELNNDLARTIMDLKKER